MEKSKRRVSKQVEPRENGYESRSLAKGLSILETLIVNRKSMPLKDLAAAVGLGKASALRLLRTLEATGYLERDGSENYSLTRDWPNPSQRCWLNRVRAAALPVLRAINEEFGETVALAFLFDDLIRVVDVIESTHQIRMSNYRGGVLQPYASSLGKSITAFQTSETAQRLLYTYGIFRLTPATLIDFRAIQEDLAQVRERGYAWDREETVPGGICIGAPIHTPAGDVVAALSISQPKDRCSAELEALLPERIRFYAEQVEETLKQHVEETNAHTTRRSSRPAPSTNKAGQ